MTDASSREHALARTIIAAVVREVDKGHAYQPRVVTDVAKTLAQYRAELRELADLDAQADLSLLTRREREIVEHMRTGMRLNVIAQRLFLSHHTVRNHVKHVFKKLGVRSQVELVASLGGRDHG